jgi:hypothetical protein
MKQRSYGDPNLVSDKGPGTKLIWYEISPDLCGDDRRGLLDLRLRHAPHHRRSSAAADQP